MPTGGSGHDPVGEALDRVVYLLDRSLAPRQKVRAFRRAIDIVAETGADEIARRARAATLTDLDGIGPSTASVIADAVLDRLVHNAHKVSMKGPSRRKENAQAHS